MTLSDISLTFCPNGDIITPAARVNHIQQIFIVLRGSSPKGGLPLCFIRSGFPAATRLPHGTEKGAMISRDSKGRFALDGDSPLIIWKNLRYTPTELSLLTFQAQKRKLSLSALIRRSIDKDTDLWLKYAGKKGRERLFRAASYSLDALHDPETIFRSCRFTAEQAEKVEKRAAKICVPDFQYLEFAVFRYVGLLTEDGKPWPRLIFHRSRPIR